jgi:hypothetical protein
MNQPYELEFADINDVVSDVKIDGYEIENITQSLLEQMGKDDNETKSRRLDAVVGSVHCEADIYEEYSGRGMYGKKCVGITTNKPMEVIETAAQYGITGAVTDSMGMDTIVYWPKIQYVSE